MKNIFKFILALTLIVSTVSCKQNRQPYHDIVYNQNGEQMVRVQDYDQNGNLVDYYIAYALFNNLYNNGGYRSVNNYYYTHRPAMDSYYNSYDRGYTYSSNPRQNFVSSNNNTSYRASAPKPSNTYSTKPAATTTYRPSAPTTNTYKAPSTSTYRASAPKSNTYNTTSSYRASAPSSNSYKSTSSYRPSAPSSSYKSSSSSSSSYRSSAPSSSYKSSSSSFSSSRSSGSSSSYRSSAPRH